MTALRELTTIGVGGEPGSITEARSRDDLIAAALELWATGNDWLVLGGGSNIVAAEELEALHILKVANLGIEDLGEGRLRVAAGETWDDLVQFAIANQLAGIASLSGIPGTVGAAPVQNVGAYGVEIADVMTRLEFLDYESGDLAELSAGECEFGYRDSVFKRGKLGVITWVEFQLQPVSGAEARQLGARRDEVLALRASKGMVWSATDADTHGCGSFFVNPIVPESVARSLPAEAPRWPSEADDGATVKLSAAWLIEQAGVHKGFALPGSSAAVSGKHTLAITNRGSCTSAQVLELAAYIQTMVSNRFGINLKPEPRLIGF